jgi:hypothetical protein
MKHIAILFSAVLAFLAVAVAAQEKESSKATGSSKATAPVEHKIVAPAELKWGEAPPGLPPGGKMAVLDGDTHPTTERITVISGTFYLGMGDKFDEAAGREMAPGSFAVLPAGMRHFGWNTGETVLQINSEGPFQIKYVNPADDPRNAKK